jgi:hypothetical protein
MGGIAGRPSNACVYSIGEAQDFDPSSIHEVPSAKLIFTM